MMQFLNMVGYSLTILIVLSLLFYIARLRKVVAGALERVLELTISEKVILDELEKALQKIEEKPVEASEGFIKFISESRDKAFSFITEIQDATKEFRNDIAEIQNSPKKSKDTKVMLEAFSKLEKKILPNDIPNN